tara:strand:+ start:264 stop:398 length:135 start_codon:yes stop_codon:yes gene_type:complete
MKLFLQLKIGRVEPEKTIASFLCGLRLEIPLIAVRIKNQKNVKN